ncbi:hypothetical protein SLS60_001023 [Paraconiothyrium brasiliense]|uniref:Uncharacterized protein n=1 Tax=Paraconiothyrium brasiliense TaxID=300254 RepID=A0ABR3S8Z4_9PLEO
MHNIEEQLALDPAYGVTSRPLLTDMLSLAAQRREGQHPVYNDSWGTAIGNLPDLKTFELILETFMEKRSQLEVVVDCAQTWKFPLRDTQYELACDGRVVDLRWAKAAAEEGGWETEAENESEEMDFDGDTSSPKHSRDEAAGKEAANDDEDMQDVEDGETDGERKHGVIDEDEAMADTSPSILLSSMRYNQGLRLDTTVCGPGPSRVGSQANQIVTPVGPSFSPLVPHNYPEHDSGLNSAGYTGNPDSYPNSPTSPAYSPASSSSDGYNPISPRYSPTSPIWTERSTEFEVRVIHFRRRRID